jgi:membrane protein implicated in regulation of membrane protease activity
MDTDILSKPELIWFIIGLIFLVLELILPGFVVFFFGLGAWVTSLVCLIANPGTNLQMVIFAVTSVITLIVFRRMLKKKLFNTNDTNSESIDDEFTGGKAMALTSFSKGTKGKVEYKGTTWTATSDTDVSAGDTVIIISRESINLFVKPIK